MCISIIQQLHLIFFTLKPSLDTSNIHVVLKRSHYQNAIFRIISYLQYNQTNLWSFFDFASLKRMFLSKVLWKNDAEQQLTESRQSILKLILVSLFRFYDNAWPKLVQIKSIVERNQKKTVLNRYVKQHFTALQKIVNYILNIFCTKVKTLKQEHTD